MWSSLKCPCVSREDAALLLLSPCSAQRANTKIQKGKNARQKRYGDLVWLFLFPLQYIYPSVFVFQSLSETTSFMISSTIYLCPMNPTLERKKTYTLPLNKTGQEKSNLYPFLHWYIVFLLVSDSLRNVAREMLLVNGGQGKMKEKPISNTSQIYKYIYF